MGRLLLVGNSRWHWAQRQDDEVLRCWHEPGPPEASDHWTDLEAWAAVGALPDGLGLPQLRRLRLEQVPLAEMPPWLGIDRALAGWQAWRRQGDGVLVADAGTSLSLTWVDGQGCFRGGRLSAGLGLQLRSLGGAAAQLPALGDGGWAVEAGPGLVDPQEAWPRETASAMVQGCLRSCAAGVVRAWHDLAHDQPGQLWLTGGDGARLMPLILEAGLAPVLAPDLCLQALAALVEGGSVR